MKDIEKDLRVAAKITTPESAKRFVKRATYKRINGQRGELIFKKKRTKSENLLLKRLQQEVGRLVGLAYPKPDMGDLQKLLDQLGREAKGSV